MDNQNLLPLLGLALRGGNLVLGEEPVENAARAKDARLLLLAADAADNTRRRVEHFADMGQCLWVRVPFTKAELGKATGRTAVAVAAVTDIGLANAVAQRLAAQDPERFDETAARLALKAQRAQQRQAEQRAHEKNLRAGRRKKATPEAPAAPQRADPPPDAGTRPGRRSQADGRTTASGRSQAGDRPKSGKRSRTGAAPKGPRSDGPRKGGGSRGPRKGAGAKPDPYAHSRPVKKGKGSFRPKG